MALIVKKVTDLFIEVRDTLQDQQQSRWSNQELYRYLDQAMRNIALATKYKLETDTINVGDPLAIIPTTDYNLKYEAIEFYKIDTEQPYEILDARTIRFPKNEEGTAVVEYYAFPDRINYGTTLEISVDEDMVDAIRYFILFRAYQKEASTENLRKADYFKGGYSEQIAQNSTRWHGKIHTELSRKDYY